jgi:Xaa-Pro dipeptidase
VREQWLTKRHAMLLPMMRRHGIAMWIVVNEEFHDDPVVHQIAPPRPYTGNRDFFVFVDAGAEGLKKFAITGYTEENLARFFEAPAMSRCRRRPRCAPSGRASQPATIALGIGGGRGQTRTLTHDTYTLIAEAMGPDAEAASSVPAPLLTEVLDTRCPRRWSTIARRSPSPRRSCGARSRVRSSRRG